MHTYTGKIEVVFSDVVSGKNGLKKLIRVHIPEGEQTHTHTHTHTHTRTHTTHHTGYDPVAKRITDQYRVVVSPKKVYLEPLKQLGLHEYLGVRSYNPCSIGRRVSLIPIPHTPMFLVKNFYSQNFHSPILHTPCFQFKTSIPHVSILHMYTIHTPMFPF